ncbi:TIM barrel protein [Candidatus Woesearchaeota archaeon]|nr:TIM barrel protein [Candidatus Woesearchaeota archaeon]
MKLGIKIWSSNVNLFEEARLAFEQKKFNFIELTAIINTFDTVPKEIIKGIPIIIHCDNANVDFSNEKNNEANIKAIKECIKFADYYNSDKIIFHPGYSDSYENVNSLLNKTNDNRFYKENMPGKTISLTSFCIGRTLEELNRIQTKNFCLDVAHAIKAARTLNLDYLQLITDLLKLKPSIVHISDGYLNSELDEHLNIGDGEFNLSELIKLLPTECLITSETPKLNGLENDLKNVSRIKQIIKEL